MEYFLLYYFKNEFINLYEEFTSHFLNNINNTTCDSCKQDLWYPFNPKEYHGYWGFIPYKGLWGKINPWWYYPYSYPPKSNLI